MVDVPDYYRKFINVSTTIAGGNPNVEFKISRNGRIDFLYHCGVLVDKSGDFHGIEIGHDIAAGAGSSADKRYRLLYSGAVCTGRYRGYFDVDYVAGKTERYMSRNPMSKYGRHICLYDSDRIIWRKFYV